VNSAKGRGWVEKGGIAKKGAGVGERDGKSKDGTCGKRPQTRMWRPLQSQKEGGVGGAHHYDAHKRWAAGGRGKGEEWREVRWVGQKSRTAGGARRREQGRRSSATDKKEGRGGAGAGADEKPRKIF